MRDEAEFWDELLAQIEAGQVIPVVGPELLTASVDGREVPLYQLLAVRLLAKYGLVGRPPPVEAAAVGDRLVALRPYNELNDAVCALLSPSRRVQDLYRPINDLYKAWLQESGTGPPPALRLLARVTPLQLFVSVTPDDLLARAIDAERNGGAEKTEHLVFAPKLASGSLRDLPEARSSGYTAVAYFFGRMSPSPFVFAIHDEDTLEFLHCLELNAVESMRFLFAELRQQNLLFIGCRFADWLTRFFVRLSNSQRLADARGKREFLVGPGGDASATLFFERFSPDTWVYPGSAHEFVAELARRWEEKHPGAATVAADPARAVPAAQPRSGDTVFVSYSRTDLAAARRLFDGLRQIGADVAWFDKSDLKPGDDWERAIRSAVGNCYLFLPVISASTETRDEGFFREEWTLAGERARRIQGRKFIIPVVVDHLYDGNAARYQLVPDSFPRVHFGHAPDGELGGDLLEELKALIAQRGARQVA